MGRLSRERRPTALAVCIGTLVVLSLFPYALVFAEVNLKWTGCGITRLAIMDEAAKAYEEETGGKVSISVTGGGSTKGIRFTAAGLSDMGGSCRPCLPETYPEEESGVFLTVVGWDALVPIVHKENPVNGVTSEQLKEILTGKITRWSELGGPDHEIKLIDRSGKITGVGFMARLLFFDDKGVDFSKSAEVLTSSGPLEERLEQERWAIGITGISSARKRLLKMLALDGKEAILENVASGAYVTFRPLYVVTRGKPSGEVEKFLNWLISDKGQAVVERSGTVSLKQGTGLKAKYKHWLHTDRILNFDALQ